MAKKFASHADVEAKQASFTQLDEGLYAYTAEGDPNTGIVIDGALARALGYQLAPSQEIRHAHA